MIKKLIINYNKNNKINKNKTKINCTNLSAYAKSKMISKNHFEFRRNFVNLTIFVKILENFGK